MSELATARLGLPMLALAQAQKELTHNEALAIIDILLHPQVEGKADDPAALEERQPGQCWIIGETPVGEWRDLAGQLACWTDSGWRYVGPIAAMRVTDRSNLALWRYENDSWALAPVVAGPSGGGVIDQEARVSINAVIVALQSAGFARAGEA